MTRRWLPLVLAAIVGVAVPVPATADASITERGWWTRRPGATPQPGGGLEVAEAPDDDISVAALRIRVPGRLSRATLVLNEIGGVRADQATLRVCVTTSNWSAANPGAWGQRPAANCAGGGLELNRSPTGGSWSANVLPILPTSGSVALMLVPGPPPSGLPVDGFQVTFGGAVLDAVAVDDEQDDDEPVTFSGPASTSPSSSDSFGFGFGGSVTPTTPPFEFAEPGVAAPPPGDTGAGESADQAFRPQPSVASRGGPGTPWARIPGLVVLAGLAGAAAAYGRRLLVDHGLLPTR